MRKFNKNKTLNKLSNRNNKNIKIASIVCSVIVLVGAIIYFSFARFESSNTYSLINGVVVQSAKDINIVAVYQGETKTDTIPAKDSGWAFKSVTCDNGSAEWDNSTWSLNVSSTGKAKCTLYFVQPTQTAVAYINSLSDTSLVSDGTTDNNKRYTGANPNNYVRFNNELWRIIGVMNNIENASGQSQSLLKIIRSESLGVYSWDSSEETINEGGGINQWGATGTYEGADLMRELNTDYLENTYVGFDGKWYSGKNNAKVDMPTSTLNRSSQSMIENVIWNLGTPTNNNGTYNRDWRYMDSSTLYTRERLDTLGNICGEYKMFCTDNVNRTSTWTGKVSLMYLSDYIFSTNPEGYCLTDSISSYVMDGCQANSWIFNSLVQWCLTPIIVDYYGFEVSSIDQSGVVSSSNSEDYVANVRPVVFLKSSVYITGGTGTSTDPYTLG